MKNYFLKLFNYDRHANNLIYEVMLKADSPFQAKQLMAHLLTAQQIWLSRCMALPAIPGTLWIEDDINIILSSEWIESTHKAWAEYISSLNDSDFVNIIAYKNSAGKSYTNLLGDICTHVINHGTHHRAQIGRYFKEQGIQNLPNTDFIAFVR